jgi:hypothetical protein
MLLYDNWRNADVIDGTVACGGGTGGRDSGGGGNHNRGTTIEIRSVEMGSAAPVLTWGGYDEHDDPHRRRKQLDRLLRRGDPTQDPRG